jgi:hypothetical protein
MDKLVNAKVNRAIKKFNSSRIAFLRKITLHDLIATHSHFLMSGEITNASDIVYHLLDEFFSAKVEALFDNLRQSLKSILSPAKIKKLGYYIAVQDAEFREEYDCKLNLITGEFIRNFCIDGKVDWGKLA